MNIILSIVAIIVPWIVVIIAPEPVCVIYSLDALAITITVLAINYDE